MYCVPFPLPGCKLYAKAYNPATAATDGGVPYMLEDFPINELAEKKTVQEVYDLILSDLDAAFALNSLPDTPANMREESVRLCSEGKGVDVNATLCRCRCSGGCVFSD